MTTAPTAGHGSVETSRQNLENDLRALGKDAEALLTQVANSTVDDFAAVRDRVAAKLDEAGAGIDQAQQALTQRAGCAAEATDKYVRGNPWLVMGIAAAAGFVAGLLLSRR